MAEPVPGWIDNFYGPVGIVFAAAIGVLRSLHADPDARAQLVPVDFLSNACLAIIRDAYNIDHHRQGKIYNVAGNVKSRHVTWRVFMETVEPSCWRAPSKRQIVYNNFKMRKNKRTHDICVFLFHTCLAHVADFVLKCVGKEPLAVKNYARLDKMISLISYFSTRSWLMDDDAFRAVWDNMEAQDRALFNFDMETLDWEKYMDNCVIGGRLYMLKDPPETIPDSFSHMYKLMVIHYSALALFWFLVYKLVMFVVDCFW